MPSSSMARWPAAMYTCTQRHRSDHHRARQPGRSGLAGCCARRCAGTPIRRSSARKKSGNDANAGRFLSPIMEETKLWLTGNMVSMDKPGQERNNGKRIRRILRRHRNCWRRTECKAGAWARRYYRPENRRHMRIWPLSVHVFPVDREGYFCQQGIAVIANALPQRHEDDFQGKGDFPCQNSISMHPPAKWPTC